MTEERKFRTRESFDTLEEIIECLSPGKVGNEMTWVGKDYSKADLIKDLQRVLQNTR